MEHKFINKNVINPFTGGLYFDVKPRKNPTEFSENNLNPYYNPVRSRLTKEERIQKILEVGQECIERSDLEKLIEEDRFLYCYDGFEPSGRMHIAQGLLKVINVNKLIDAGCIFVFWVADWFAMLNDKMFGDLDKIRTLGKYFVEIWKAAGMKMSNVKFLWASDFINKRPEKYWMTVMRIAKNNNLTRIKKCATIMGREESDSLSVAQMFYPCMQCTDIFFMDIDICQLGMDQRKVNMLARETAKSEKIKSPVILSSHMIGGLKEGKRKMSKSDPENAIFMCDSAEDVRRKIKNSCCKEGVLEDNVPIEFVKFFILNLKGEFYLKRFKGGEDCVYKNLEDLENDFKDMKVHPDDLKKSLSLELNKILQPIRDHFEYDPNARQTFKLTKQYQEEYYKAMKQLQKQKNKAINQSKNDKGKKQKKNNNKKNDQNQQNKQVQQQDKKTNENLEQQVKEQKQEQMKETLETAKEK